ncbi:ancient ubiquitous protein 1 [Thecamonas trahens ATCC 50062]|uniref:Ancient ubiquitous protein 1 n=1 Tax=Thecamonas trahens ATCC 50062 TaxID=461836 RepID=A0A0L0DQ61_THETB|nr:ancient ubiquitous protein 1 [Thecamonas trahens ATCC 50062]KNC54444.1 ancient ubiquitous protein 1 [Thecamonas trahens ATCC 50062]|eukprot:XP_013753600.1 ancient ubiquitous protein 1 [Thecamonas trahens ATCC 50062]
MSASHVSAFDVFPLLAVTRVRVVLDAGFYARVLNVFGGIIGAVPIDKSAGASTRAQVHAAAVDTNGAPMLFFPEGWDTNGRCLLRFNRFVFSVGVPVVPVALSAAVVGLPLVPGMLGSNLVRELCWLFFAPMTSWTVTVGSTLVRDNGESPEAFAQRAQHAVGKLNGAVPSGWTDRDALKLRRGLMARD